jgi:hypothetical protein
MVTKFILHYQDHLTKFAVLRPLTSKLAAEVGFQLLDIFLLFGAPHILQSDNGREFTAHGLLCSLESEEDLVKHRFLILLACLLIDSEAFRLSSEITSSLKHK